MVLSDQGRCAWILDRIDPYIDGDVTGEDKPIFEEHVGKCEKCSLELVLARRVAGDLRSIPGLSCPGHVVERAVERVDRPAPTRGARLWGWFGGRGLLSMRPALAAVFMIVAAVTVFILSDHFRSPGFDQPTEKELETAKQEVLLAFAYVGKASRKTGFVVRDEVFGDRVVAPIRELWSRQDKRPQSTNDQGGSK